MTRMVLLKLTQMKMKSSCGIADADTHENEIYGIADADTNENDNFMGLLESLFH